MVKIQNKIKIIPFQKQLLYIKTFTFQIIFSLGDIPWRTWKYGEGGIYCFRYLIPVSRAPRKRSKFLFTFRNSVISSDMIFYLPKYCLLFTFKNTDLPSDILVLPPKTLFYLLKYCLTCRNTIYLKKKTVLPVEILFNSRNTVLPTEIIFYQSK